MLSAVTSTLRIPVPCIGLHTLLLGLSLLTQLPATAAGQPPPRDQAAPARPSTRAPRTAPSVPPTAPAARRATAPATRRAFARPPRIRYSLEASLGLEYDSNATRLDSTGAAEGETPVQAGLLRGQAHGALWAHPTKSLVLKAIYDLAGKVFFEESARSQDALIHRLRAQAALRLGDGLAAQVAGLYHEGFQRRSGAITPGAGLLAFRLLEAKGSLLLVPGSWLVVAVGIGARRFTYKPDPLLDFDSLLGHAALQGSWTLGEGAGESQLEASLGYSLSRREYGAPMERPCTTETCRAQCAADSECDPALPITFAYPGSHRVDLVHRLSAGITWVGPVLLSATYALGVSGSNSFGLGYLRHDATLRCVASLGWRLYLTAQIRLRLLSSEVPGGVDARTLGFAEENRSHALLQLERRLGRGFRAVVRYTFFAGDLAHPNDAALRHLVYAGVAFRYPAK